MEDKIKISAVDKGIIYWTLVKDGVVQFVTTVAPDFAPAKIVQPEFPEDLAALQVEKETLVAAALALSDDTPNEPKPTVELEAPTGE